MLDTVMINMDQLIWDLKRVGMLLGEVMIPGLSSITLGMHA